MLKKYREENVSDFYMNGTKHIAKKIGFKIKGIPIQKNYIPEGYMVQTLSNDADEYIYEIYKTNSRIKSLESIFEKFEGIIENLLANMLSNKEGIQDIYKSYLYLQLDKVNEQDPSLMFKLDLDNEPMYNWQKEAYETWKENQYKGTFEVATGCGKTKFALYGIQKIKEKYNDINIMIIVPTKALMDNWYDNLIEKLHIPTKFIGRKGNNRNEEERKITIYIDKTAQNKFRDDFLSVVINNERNNTDYFNFIIADECHHYESPQNIKMFDKINFLPKSKTTRINYCSIALSATLPYDYSTTGKLRNYLGNNIYNYSFMKALGDSIISPINIVDVSYKLNIDEQRKYGVYKNELVKAKDELKYVLKKNNISFKEEEMRGLAYYYLKKFQGILDCIEEKKLEFQQKYGYLEWRIYFDDWLYELSGKNEEIVLSVKNYIGKFERLKKLLLNAEDRKKRCLELARRHSEDKIIIFGEYIQDIEEIYFDLVNEFGNEKVKLYHSQLDKKVKEKVMKSLKLGSTRIICVPTAFDEGVDIPDMSVGIIYQGKRSKRQQIQRLGRIMRKAEGKYAAIMYNLCNPTYGENKFLDRFINEQLCLIQEMDPSGEELELVQERLNIEAINYDEEIMNNRVIDKLIDIIRK